MSRFFYFVICDRPHWLGVLRNDAAIDGFVTYVVVASYGRLAHIWGNNNGVVRKGPSHGFIVLESRKHHRSPR